MLLVVVLAVDFQKFNLAIKTGPKEPKVALESLSYLHNTLILCISPFENISTLMLLLSLQITIALTCAFNLVKVVESVLPCFCLCMRIVQTFYQHYSVARLVLSSKKQFSGYMN